MSKSLTGCGTRLIALADFCAPSFEQNGVSPQTIHLTDLFPKTHRSEAAAFVHFQTGLVLGEDTCLEGPDMMLFADVDQSPEQGFANLPAAVVAGDIDADLGDPGVDATAGNGGEGGPADHLVVLEGYQAAMHEVGTIPDRPFRGAGLEGGMAGGDTLLVDGFYGGPVFGKEGFDVHNRQRLDKIM